MPPSRMAFFFGYSAIDYLFIDLKEHTRRGYAPKSHILIILA